MMRLLYFPLLMAFALVACDQKQEVPVESKPETQAEVVDQILPDTEADEAPQAVPAPPPAPSQQVQLPPIEETFAQKLAQAALERTTYSVVYDGSYRKISYPMGDVPGYLGVCTDVVIRSYRQLGIDLQEKVHEDIKRNFKKYPNQKRWGLNRPDPNIDHRRVPNLRVFFSRHGESLEVTDNAENYKPGDLVTWKINDKMVHIGVVAEETSYTHSERHLIIHNIGRGPELSDMLFDFEITGHYRYHPDEGI